MRLERKSSAVKDLVRVRIVGWVATAYSEHSNSATFDSSAIGMLESPL